MATESSEILEGSHCGEIQGCTDGDSSAQYGCSSSKPLSTSGSPESNLKSCMSNIFAMDGRPQARCVADPQRTNSLSSPAQSSCPTFQTPSATSDAALLIKFQLLQGMQSRGGKVGISISRCIRWVGSLSHTIISSGCPLEALNSLFSQILELTGLEFQ